MGFGTPTYQSPTFVLYESEPPATCNFCRGGMDTMRKALRDFHLVWADFIEVLAYPYSLSDLSLGHQEGQVVYIFKVIYCRRIQASNGGMNKVWPLLARPSYPGGLGS